MDGSGCEPFGPCHAALGYVGGASLWLQPPKLCPEEGSGASGFVPSIIRRYANSAARGTNLFAMSSFNVSLFTI